MRTAAVSALCLAAGVSAFKGTAPLLIWGNDETSEYVKNVQSALPSGAASAAEVYGQLRRLGCDWKEVVVVHVPELHNSHLPALTLPKADLSIPYLVQPSRSELDNSLGEWADVCGAKVFENPSMVDGKGIVHITAYVHDSKINLPVGADLVIVTSDPSIRKPSAPLTVTDARSPSAIEKLSAKLALKPKAKRSKYLAPVKRQGIDFGALEEGLKAEIEELEGKLEDLGDDWGITGEGEQESQSEQGEEQQQQNEGGEEDEFLSRPQVIDDDSAYADAQNAGEADEYQQRPYPGEGDDDGDNDDDDDDSGRNRTSPVDPNAPLLDRVQLFTTPLLTALLVSFLIFIPVIMLGIKSLADIQVPPRMMEISKGAQLSKEKKDQ